MTLTWLSDTVEMYQPTGTLDDLVPSVRPHFDALVAQATVWGMKPHVRSVGRTCAEQQEQVKLGYSHADLCRSMHVLGHAVDLDLTPNTCATYTKLGQWWEGQGGVWGGRFPGFGDCGDSGHFQYGFAKAGAVPTSVCPSGVTLAECAKIREQYLDAANAAAPSSNRRGLFTGLAIAAVGVAFVWATMRVRPGALAGMRDNPEEPKTTVEEAFPQRRAYSAWITTDGVRHLAVRFKHGIIEGSGSTWLEAIDEVARKRGR